MQLIPYEGLPDLPRRFWKKVYTPEEKAVISAYNKARAAKLRVGNPMPHKSYKVGEERSHRAVAATTYNLSKINGAVPSCHTEADREAVYAVYKKAWSNSKMYSRMSVDHIYPLNGQRYGVSGLHVAANLVVMSLVENMQKGCKPHPTWSDYSDTEWTLEDVKQCLSLHRPSP